MVLLTLASKQIWPQVLAVAHLKQEHPLERVILLHSEDVAESKGPAQRLQCLFDENGLIAKGASLLEPISHDDFTAIESRFDEVIAQHQLNLGECIVNFTGGNKLMAAAVFRRMARRGVPGFYLERDRQITWFEPCEGDLRTRTERLPPGLANDLDPASLLICQFGHDVVPFPGERLNLNPKGARATTDDLAAKLSGETRIDHGAFDFRKWLQIDNPSRRLPNDGDNLEYGTACALLQAGVPSVRRSVELGANSKSQNREAELDLVFNWNDRLWVVDCKDRIGGTEKVESLRTAILRQGPIDRQRHFGSSAGVSLVFWFGPRPVPGRSSQTSHWTSEVARRRQAKRVAAPASSSQTSHGTSELAPRAGFQLARCGRGPPAVRQSVAVVLTSKQVSRPSTRPAGGCSLKWIRSVSPGPAS